MRYVIIINNDEAVDNGDESDFDDVKYEVGELLRSGYIQVEDIRELDENATLDIFDE